MAQLMQDDEPEVYRQERQVAEAQKLGVIRSPQQGGILVRLHEPQINENRVEVLIVYGVPPGAVGDVVGRGCRRVDVETPRVVGLIKGYLFGDARGLRQPSDLPEKFLRLSRLKPADCSVPESFGQTLAPALRG